jgi:hypothetical protein
MAYGVAVEVRYRGDGRGTVEKAPQTEVETSMVGSYPSVEFNFNSDRDQPKLTDFMLSHSDRFTMANQWAMPPGSKFSSKIQDWAKDRAQIPKKNEI